MVLLPNIRFLNLGTSSETYGAYVQDLWRQLLGSQSKKTRELYGVVMESHVDFLSQTERPAILSRLEYFSARADNSTYEDAPNIDIVEEILTIPTLKEFYCWGLEQPSCEDICLPLAHLKRVYLDDCRVSEDALACIVDNCKQLECLDVVYSEWSRWAGVTLDMPFLVTLAQRKDTLKRLTLLLPPSFKQRNHHSYITAPFDLRRLTNLVTLSIDYTIIFSERESRPGEDGRQNPKFPKNLPRSIEQLHIQCCRLDQGMSMYALCLLEARRRYKKLKTLQVTYETFEAKNAAEKKQMISLSSTVRLFKDYGLELRIESEEGQVIVPAEFEDSDAAKKYRRFVLDAPDSESDDWDDVDSDDDIGFADDVDEDEDGDNDNDDDEDDIDDEMDEETHTEEQGRYNLRPR